MGSLEKGKRQRKRALSLSSTEGLASVNLDIGDFIPGPKLRAKLGISAVTLWRWRHSDSSEFPAPKVINGRLYFPLGAVSAWLAKQPEAP
jgi:predicted DNA-binding transcriptional regulator AlpA